jgi:RimJ/RimL family protein N-acetyltransferase
MPAYTIRDVTPDDAEATLNFLKMIADEPHNTIHLASAAEITSTVEQERQLIDHFMDSDTARWLLAVDEQGALVGSLTVRPYRGLVNYHTVFAGLMIARAWRNQGIGTALMRQAVSWCAANPHIKRLELDVLADNAPAIHVYEKLGFVREGVKRSFAYKEGRFHDTIFMGIVFPRPDLDL